MQQLTSTNGKYAIFPWITWNNKSRLEQALFNGVRFDSFEAGWDYIYAANPEPEETSPEWQTGWYDDYFVELIDQFPPSL